MEMELMCRICLIALEEESYSICTPINSQHRAVDYLNEALRLKIDPNDGLPQGICSDCFTNSIEVYKFYQQIINSEEQLKQIQIASLNKMSTSENEYDGNYHDGGDEFITPDTIGFNKKSRILHKCSECNESFYYENNFKLHNYLEHDNNSNSLQKQENQGENQSVSENSTKSMYDCKICNIVFKYEKNYNLHFETEHDAQASNDSYKKERRQKFRLQFVCPVCECNFRYKSNYEIHRKRHQFEVRKKIKCPNKGCGSTFTSAKSMRLHYNRLHFQAHKNLLCSTCGMQFDTKQEYMSHIKKHSKYNTKKFKCGLCEKSFSSSSQCKMHTFVHTGERPHVCYICNKSFSQLSTLNTHMTLHFGKQIRCSLCNKRFSRKGHLQIHMRTHLNERPYSCDKCPKNFFQMSHLKTHLESHSDRKLFECNECNKKFLTNMSLRNHMIKHQENLFKCPYCNMNTYNPGWFRKHLLKYHNVTCKIEMKQIQIDENPVSDAVAIIQEIDENAD